MWLVSLSIRHSSLSNCLLSDMPNVPPRLTVTGTDAISSYVARREIRKWLAASTEGQEIDHLVAQLLKAASSSTTEGG